MNKAEDLPAVALIAGPTASGKSALALALAERTGGTIINADASQWYRDLRVLSARPGPEDEAHAPHRLFGVGDGAEPLSAATWAAHARAEIDGAHDRGSVPILVGGTGLYIRTLLDGIAPIPEIDPAVRAAVRALDVAAAHSALMAEDPAAAAAIRPSDSSRIARALEVIRATGRSVTSWRQIKQGGIAGRIRIVPLILLPPRDWLRARCDERFQGMLRVGAIEEVDALVARRLAPDLPIMRAIGVREIAAWRAGAIDRAAMVAKATAATRQYAKRQTSWFRHQPPSDWHRASNVLDVTQIAEHVTKLRDALLTR